MQKPLKSGDDATEDSGMSIPLVQCPKSKDHEPIGVDLPGVYDGVLFWECLDCGHRWHRFGETSPLHAKADPYVSEGKDYLVDWASS